MKKLREVDAPGVVAGDVATDGDRCQALISHRRTGVEALISNRWTGVTMPRFTGLVHVEEG